MVGVVVAAAPLQQVPQRRPLAEPSRVATLQRLLRKSMLFCGWCCGRGFAPVSATVPMIVDFLVHLFRDKGLSVSAIKGFRAALSSVFALKGMDLADSRPISMLFRSFSKSVRPEELRPPAWDVTLVLQSLTRAPYEPLRTSDERFLVRKTLFLLALASAKRVGELHALSHRISHSRDWGEVSFAFVADFAAKTLDPSSSACRFEGFYCTGPAKLEYKSQWETVMSCADRQVLPGPQCERLFVTAGCSTKEILKNTVSVWLRKTIS